MKRKNKLIAGFLIMGAVFITAFSSCAKSNGKVTFWTQDTDGVGYVTVTANGTTANITVDKTSTPTCDATGCATFSLAPGNYTYTAQETTAGTNGTVDAWSSTSFTITENGCLTVRLYD